MQFDLALRLGDILQFLGIVGGGMLVLTSMRVRLDQLERSTEAIKDEIKAIGKVITNQAIQDVKISRMETDIQDLQEWRERRSAGQRQ